jgi:hypothetical protein
MVAKAVQKSVAIIVPTTAQSLDASCAATRILSNWID